MTLKSVTGGEEQKALSFALGLGLTNECNLACAFCYRDPARTDRLTLGQVTRVVESLPLRSVNLGTGENGMHPEFPAILAYLRQQPLKLTMTSNGYSVQVLPDEDLRAFHEIEFSLDYPNEREQDAQRGAGNWALIHEQAARCRNLGVPVTFIAVMMRSNFDRLGQIAAIAKAFLITPLSPPNHSKALPYNEKRPDRRNVAWREIRYSFKKVWVLQSSTPVMAARSNAMRR
jgi:MoaA/NifB/PqqE/SkfB family radical SAM enzyme